MARIEEDNGAALGAGSVEDRFRLVNGELELPDESLKFLDTYGVYRYLEATAKLKRKS